MLIERVHYFVARKNPRHGQAILRGFGAREIGVERARPVRNALHLIGGLQFGALPILKAVIASGEPYVFFDRAYFGGGPGSSRLRVVPWAYQHHWVEPCNDARFKHWGVTLQPWRYGGRHILLVPPGEAIRQLFDLGDWEADILNRLRACTDRPIDVSRKGDARPLAQRLTDCWCVVTWSSNVAVDAIVAGVPAVCAGIAAAAPVAGRLDQLENAIERPLRPDRQPWAQHLAWGQWSTDEISRGDACRHLERLEPGP